MDKVSVYEIQSPLRAQYKAAPETAWVSDHARTTGADPCDPFHATVEPMTGAVSRFDWRSPRVGGRTTRPTPGDILCAALASCQDSAVRMVANLLAWIWSFSKSRLRGS